MVLDQDKDHPSRWSTVVSIGAQIGCRFALLAALEGQRRGTGVLAERVGVLQDLVRDVCKAHLAG